MKLTSLWPLCNGFILAKTSQPHLLQFSYTASLPGAAATAVVETTFLSIAMAPMWLILMGKTDDLYKSN